MPIFIAICTALPTLGLSVALIWVWIDPMAWDDGRWVPYAVGLMLMEFLILHSSGFVVHMAAAQASLAGKLKVFAGLALMYGLMGLGFALSTDSPSLLWLLLGVMVGRFAAALRADLTKDPAFNARLVIGVMAYLGAVFASIMLPVPELGVTREVVNEVYPSRGSGIWERYPERAIAGGALYFGVMGFVELTLGWRAPNARAVGQPTQDRKAVS